MWVGLNTGKLKIGNAIKRGNNLFKYTILLNTATTIGDQYASIRGDPSLILAISPLPKWI